MKCALSLQYTSFGFPPLCNVFGVSVVNLGVILLLPGLWSIDVLIMNNVSTLVPEKGPPEQTRAKTCDR